MSTIVIIEDNQSDCEVVRTALAEASITSDVITFSDGQKGVEFVLANHPELCPICLFILDINLPRHSGHEVLAAIQQGPYKDVPIIVMTSSRRPEDSKAILGKAYYFRKPLELEEFLAIGRLAAKIKLKIPFDSQDDCRIPA